MVLVLFALFVLFSLLTLNRESATGAAAASRLSKEMLAAMSSKTEVFVVGAVRKPSGDFAGFVAADLGKNEKVTVTQVIGTPRDLRQAWDTAEAEGNTPSLLVVSGDVLKWTIL